MRRLSYRHLQRVLDYAIPWGVGIFLSMVVLDYARFELLGLLLAVASGAALRWRRRKPELTLAVTLLAGLGILLLAPEVVIPIAGLFAIFSLAATRPPQVSLIGLAALLALSATNFLTATVDDSVFTLVLAVGSWALGEAARTRRIAIEEAARRAIGEEQARIARELHDVIAHSVSVIVVQAAAAGDVFDARPDQARAALGSIERAGREALLELRRLLGAVRPDARAEDPTRPQPGLERLDELAEPLREGGLRVVVRREGQAATVPAGVDLSAYRIVQEALTNTLRHARATSAEVTVRYGADAVEVDVRDDGRAAMPANGDGEGEARGHGLVGMRERALLLGGTLEAGPQPRGGYRVYARLPLGTAT